MTDRRIPVANVYYLLCYAWRHVAESDLVRLDTLEGFERIHDLLGSVLAQGTFKLVRRGIDRGYREVREELTGIRGKLAVCETAKRALRGRGRAACDFRGTVSRRSAQPDPARHARIARKAPGPGSPGAGRGPQGLAEARRRERTAAEPAAVRKGATRPQPPPRALPSGRVPPGARAVAGRPAVRDREVQGLPVGEDGELFEDFAIEFYRRELPDYEIGQRGIRWDDDGTAADQRPMLPSMEADVVLETRARPAGAARRIVLDTKFYREALGGRHGARKLCSNHLYQLLAYLRNREATARSGPRHEGILLYPVVDAPLRIDVRLEGCSIRARSVDLSRDWRRVHEEMLDVIS